MCGITGYVVLNEHGKEDMRFLTAAANSLHQRGPDHTGLYKDHRIGLGHARLSILDTSERSNQPFSDPSGRYVLVFNGEIFNYRELRRALVAKGIAFHTESDTEVLLHLLILEGTEALQKLNGFFAFSFYDRETGNVLLARDRLGIKPLLYYQDENKLIFGSEMKALMAYEQKREINQTALEAYFTLQYIPAPDTILNKHYKLLPGWLMTIEGDVITRCQWWNIEDAPIQKGINYHTAQEKLRQLLDQSVQRRLIADVSLGSFLSGGVDSSIIATLASAHTKNLQTFSIGFKDAPFFDETHYAQAVAEKIKSNHTVFSLTMDDLYDHMDSAVSYLDEPFADSSAIAVSMLCKRTRNEVTVALSGDGADELFSGYNKHAAEFRVRNSHLTNASINLIKPLLAMFSQSRNSAFANKMRQVNRYADGMNLNNIDRYWAWASVLKKEEVRNLLLPKYVGAGIDGVKEAYLSQISKDFNSILLADLKLVLPNDMLTKVDMMSMSHGLEVRTPFLDHELVNFVNGLPAHYKIDRKMRKKILQDTFRNDLPDILFNRPKKGFEIPLLQWFETVLKDRLEERYLNRDFILEQGIFNPHAVDQIRQKLFSGNPGDTPSTVWALVVFHEWWLKYMK